MVNQTITKLAEQPGMSEMQKAVARETHITIREVENGRIVVLKQKVYIVPSGVSLLETIGQALVEAKLES